MANTITSAYSGALGAQRQKLEGYIATSAKAVALPSQKADDAAKDKLLDISGWVLIVIGVLGFIAGIIVGVGGIIIAGIASIGCGVYCYAKSIQLGRQRAFAASAAQFRKSLDDITTHVSGEWNSFINSQNATLTRDIITSQASIDAKVAMVEKIATAPVCVDMTATDKALKEAMDEEVSTDFNVVVSDYVAAANSALTSAGNAQASIYNAVDAANK